MFFSSGEHGVQPVTIKVQLKRLVILHLSDLPSAHALVCLHNRNKY